MGSGAIFDASTAAIRYSLPIGDDNPKARAGQPTAADTSKIRGRGRWLAA